MRVSYSLLASIAITLQQTSATLAASLASINVRADNQACAKAASAAASYATAHPNARFAQVPAQTAYDCLKTVPLKKDPAVALVKGLKPYVQLQSSVDYLRNPPSGYLWDPADIPRLLDAIETKLLSKDTYDSEYDFQTDLYSAFLAARDGHFAFGGDAFNVFGWIRDLSFQVVSVSLDGKEVPKVYAAADILDIASDSVQVLNIKSISPVKSVNGLDVETFFLAESNTNLGQDPDSSWNTRFFHISDYFQKGNLGQWNTPTFYPGPTTSIEFQNGTKVTINNMAIPAKDLTGISTGEDFYKSFCSGNSTTSSSSSSSDQKRDVRSLLRRQSESDSSLWPTPDVSDGSGVLTGYIPDDSDIAILVVSSFLPGKATAKDLVSFQDTVSNFFAAAVEAGKNKLIIDLQGNGGGSLDLSIDLSAQLFPTVAPNSKDNMRASLGMYSIILAGSNAAEQANSADAATDAVVDYTVVPFAYQEVMTPDLKNFNRIQDFYGPSHVGTGFFTNFFQGNYTNDSPSQFGLPGIVITGTNNRKDYKQPFDAENVIMLTDGYCASACTIFSEHMKRQGVQVITMGGRPQTGPMQAVGGTKGSQVFDAPNVQIMLELFSNETLNADLDKAKGTLWENFNTLPIDRSGGFVSINGRNQFRIGDNSQTPLQFVYEAADCRIYETPEMAASPVAIWERVAELAFEKRSNGVITSDYCVKDSIKHATSLSGGLKAGNGDIGPQTPPTNAKSKQSGLLINGNKIVNGLASGEVDKNSKVDPTVATDDGESTANSPDVLAAVDTMLDVCKEYKGSEWFVELLCGALSKKTGGS